MSPSKSPTIPKRSTKPKKKPVARASASEGPTYAKVSSAAVEKATGKGWNEWLAILDRAGATKLEHKAIAELLSAKHGVPPWWSQMVTVGYEQARGMRKALETKTGFSVSATRVIAAPIAEVWRAFEDAKQRKTWFGSARWTVSSATKERSMRGAFEDGPSRLEAMLYAKGPAKTQVALQHGKIATEREARERKAYWGERLDALRERLEARAR